MKNFLITMPFRITECDDEGKTTYISSDRVFEMDITAENMEDAEASFVEYFHRALFFGMMEAMAEIEAEEGGDASN